MKPPNFKDVDEFIADPSTEAAANLGIKPVSKELVTRIRALVGDVEVDLDARLPADDE